MLRAAPFLLVVAAAGCAGHQQLAPSSAELGFSRTAAPGGLSGRFDSIDGKRLDGSPLTIHVAAGAHVIGYACPDVISVDPQRLSPHPLSQAVVMCWTAAPTCQVLFVSNSWPYD